MEEGKMKIFSTLIMLIALILCSSCASNGQIKIKINQPGKIFEFQSESISAGAANALMQTYNGANGTEGVSQTQTTGSLIPVQIKNNQAYTFTITNGPFAGTTIKPGKLSETKNMPVGSHVIQYKWERDGLTGNTANPIQINPDTKLIIF